MGISRSSVKILMREATRRPFSGSAICLGRQNIWSTADQIRRAAYDMGFTLANAGPVAISSDPEMGARGYVSDSYLFKQLGFSSLESLDYSAFEGAEHVFDLNSPELPDHLRGRFDAVIDGGTIEHVFHVPNALANIHRLLKPGGRVIHFSPACNHLDHGFYMFSPTLFADYYAANRYEINSIRVARYTPRHDIDQWELWDYTPGSLDPVSFGRVDAAMYAVIVIATRGPDAICDAIPQQGMYRRMWGNPGTPLTAQGPTSVWRNGSPVDVILAPARWTWRRWLTYWRSRPIKPYAKRGELF